MTMACDRPNACFCLAEVAGDGKASILTADAVLYVPLLHPRHATRLTTWARSWLRLLTRNRR